MPGGPHILGLSAFYHDAAAALVSGGRIVAAAQEERFSRRKHDERFPAGAVAWCLRQADLEPGQLDAVVFYDKPILKFARLLESYLAVAPRGWRTFCQVVPGWLGEKLNLRHTLREELPGLRAGCPLLFTTHHQAHAASAFFPSPFAEAAILTVDGVGEWATTTVGRGRGTHLELLKEIRFPHSLGLLYTAFTGYCGFRVNSGEYKLMGLAPYGEPRFADRIRSELLELRPDGSFWLNLDYFAFLHGTTMTNERFHRLFEGPPRQPEEPVQQRHMDVARSMQVVTEEVMLRLARHTRELTGLPHLCLAGGVALNCVANGRILRDGLFERLWIQPAAGDAGGALGAALAAWHGHFGGGRWTEAVGQMPVAGSQMPDAGGRMADAMQGALLGPEFSDAEIESALRGHGAVWERLDREALLDRTVELLAAGKVVPVADGVRSPCPGQPLDLGRPAFAHVAVGDEPQGQVPRVVPAVRAGGAAGAGGRLLRSGRRVPLHAAGGAGAAGTAPAGPAGVAWAGPAPRHALDPARHHPRGFLGAPPNGGCGAVPPAVRAAAAVGGGHRLRRARQHLLQRARRAHRVHTR